MPSPPDPAVVEPQAQREAIRRGLSRANLSAVLSLLVIAGLALGAVWKTRQAERERARAVGAEEDARDKLWSSYLAQARASRLTGQMGHRVAAWDAIVSAAQLRPSVELRSEAIGCLALCDLRADSPVHRWPAETCAWAIDADAARFALGDFRGRVTLRRFADDAELRALGPLNAAIARLVFSADGKLLGARTWQGQTAVWGLEKGDLLYQGDFPFSFQASALALGGDESQVLAVCADNTIRIHDLASGREEARIPLPPELPVEPAVGISCDPSGRYLAVTAGKSLSVRDLGAGKPVFESTHDDNVDQAVWSHDGSLLAVPGWDARVYVYDVPAYRRLVFEGHDDVVSGGAFSPDGEVLASRSWDGTTRLWEAATGRALCRTSMGFALQFSSDGGRLGYCVENLGVGVWRFLPSEGYRLLAGAPGGGLRERGFECVSFSSDGRLLAASGARGLRIWDAGGARLLAEESHSSTARSIAFLPQGGLITGGSSGVLRRGLEVEGGDALRVRLGPPEALRVLEGRYTERIAASSDGRFLAACAGTEAAVIDLSGVEPAVTLEHGDHTPFIAISPDARWAATGTWGGAATRVWEARTGKALKDLTGTNAAVAFTPDSRWLVTGRGPEYRFWRTGTWEPGLRIERESASGLVAPMAFTPDGRLMAITRTLQLVQIVDAATGDVVTSLPSPDRGNITWLAFSPDGRRLAAATHRETVQLWDLSRLRERLATIGLDWTDAAPGLPAAPPAMVAGSEAHDVLGMDRTTVLAIFGGLTAGVLAILALGRHRRLVEGYRKVDELVMQRNSELEAAQAEILRGEKMKALGTLAAGIAHDFNNLLSVVNLSNDFLRRGVAGDPDLLEEVESIHLAVQQGRGVARSMLGYSRGGEERFGPYSVADVVDDTVALLSRQYLSGITLKLEIDRSVPRVEGSAARLEQVLLNLVVNAAEAMQGRGTLLVAVHEHDAGGEGGFMVLPPRQAPRHVELVVGDSGPGIDPQILPRIFEPFFTTKVDGARRGTGLGLHMIFTIAQQDGLGLRVQTAAGQGTVFRVSVPAME